MTPRGERWDTVGEAKEGERPAKTGFLTERWNGLHKHNEIFVLQKHHQHDEETKVFHMTMEGIRSRRDLETRKRQVFLPKLPSYRLIASQEQDSWQKRMEEYTEELSFIPDEQL